MRPSGRATASPWRGERGRGRLRSEHTEEREIVSRVEWNEKLGRMVRMDAWDELAVPTHEKLREAIAAGRTEEALALADLLIGTTRSMHHLLTDWCWALLSFIARTQGEEVLGQALEETVATWARPRYGPDYGPVRAMTPEERVRTTVEAMHSHLPYNPSGKPVEIIEEEDRWVLKFDPCGSGGRMRRGDPLDGTPPRTEPPYNFLTVQQPHDWSWNKTGVCLYCTECALVNEIWAIDALGFPFRVTNPPDDPNQPCVWYIYKRPEDIPEEFYTRVGRRKPSGPAPGPAQPPAR